MPRPLATNSALTMLTGSWRTIESIPLTPRRVTYFKFCLRSATSPKYANSASVIGASAIWPANAPIFSASCAYASTFARASGATSGALTALFAEPPRRTSRHWYATEIATFFCASTVLAPRCGVTITESRVNSGESVGGSFSKTSSAAPATLPATIAS